MIHIETCKSWETYEIKRFDEVIFNDRNHLTRIRLNRAFSLGGNGFDEGIVKSLGVPGVSRVIWWPYGAEQVSMGRWWWWVSRLRTTSSLYGLYPLGSSGCSAPDQEFTFLFLASCLATAAFFSQLHRLHKSHIKSSTLDFGKQWKYSEKIHS